MEYHTYTDLCSFIGKYTKCPEKNFSCEQSRNVPSIHIFFCNSKIQNAFIHTLSTRRRICISSCRGLVARYISRESEMVSTVGFEWKESRAIGALLYVFNFVRCEIILYKNVFYVLFNIFFVCWPIVGLFVKIKKKNNVLTHSKRVT